jgi:hypothetical protein
MLLARVSSLTGRRRVGCSTTLKSRAICCSRVATGTSISRKYVYLQAKRPIYLHLPKLEVAGFEAVRRLRITRPLMAWLLQRSPNVLLIPGTSSVAHLRDNIKGAALTLPENELTELNSIG